MKWFDDEGFYNYYMNSSKYSKKQELYRDFCSFWYDKFGYNNRLNLTSWAVVNNLWKAPNKKDLKVKLIARGYSSQAIDALFKTLSTWLKATK